MSMVRCEQRNVWITPNGAEFFTREEAETEAQYERTFEVLDGLEVYWRETCPEDVARALHKLGFSLVLKEPT